MTTREKFFRYVAQTSSAPLGIEIDRAEGAYFYDVDGNRYLDLISGIGVANIGHARPEVIQAIEAQAKRYLHAMVYGELIESPQAELAAQLAGLLPGEIDNLYFTNSGAEGVEGALKLARKFTGRREIISFTGCYHGDTMGALSCQDQPLYRRPFEPCVPAFRSLPWNDIGALTSISDRTAGVIIEPVQAEGGVRVPSAAFMRRLRQRCSETGALLIFDEVMTGFGRTGKIFAAEHWQIAPDIIVLAKALGGGLPLGAFAAPRAIMRTLAENPPLSHVTTFGGHPLSCAAGLAALEILRRENLAAAAVRIGAQFCTGIARMPAFDRQIKEIRGLGSLIGLEFTSAQRLQAVVAFCRKRGVIIGWTLYRSNVLRMAPPLILQEPEIAAALQVLEDALQHS